MALAQFGGAGGRPAPGVDLSGNWTPSPHEEEVGDPSIAEFAGVPINQGAQAWGLAWSPSRVTLRTTAPRPTMTLLTSR